MKPSALPAARAVAALVVAAALMFGAVGRTWAQVAGRFLVVVGDVQLTGKDGKARKAEKGADLLEGDRVVTGAASLVQVRLKDQGLISVRPETQLVFDRFAFQGKDDSNASLVLSLVKGGLRSITGLIGVAHRDGYRINTPSATIGIRGTDHEPFVIPPGTPGGFDPGTYDKVNAGMTVLKGLQGGAIQIGIGQAAFVPPSGANPVILPAIPSFYKQDLPVPDTVSRVQKPDGDAKPGDPKAGDAKGNDRQDIVDTLKDKGGPDGALPRRRPTDDALRDAIDPKRAIGGDAPRRDASTPIPDPKAIAPTVDGLKTAPTLDTPLTIRTVPIDTTTTTRTLTTPLDPSAVKSLDSSTLRSITTTPIDTKVIAPTTTPTPITTTPIPTPIDSTSIRSIDSSTLRSIDSSTLKSITPTPITR